MSIGRPRWPGTPAPPDPFGGFGGWQPSPGFGPGWGQFPAPSIPRRANPYRGYLPQPGPGVLSPPPQPDPMSVMQNYWRDAMTGGGSYAVGRAHDASRRPRNPLTHD